MANQITDNRVLINSADSVTNYVSLAGAAAGTLDIEIFYQGTGSVGRSISNTLDGLLYNLGAPTNVANNTFYFLINSGIVGLLATKAAGGMRIRFTGATVTDWFEVYVAGSDEWPTSFAGGWTLFVVDIETARATAITNGWTSGTVPATTAIQRFGYASVTGGTMPRMVDNTWMDASYRLPDNSPAIIVEGRNGGTTDWNWNNIVTQGALTQNPVARFGDGGAITLSGPVQFGINDTTVHGFSDSNKVILWDNQEFVPNDVYSLSAVGNVGGTTNVTFGVKSGTGDAASGAQGLIISAASTGARWSMDFNDPNLDLIGFYGCSFQHADNLLLDDSAVDVVSTLLIDCSSATLSTVSTSVGNFLRNSIIDANTTDAVPFIISHSMNDIVFCNFQFSDGYAIELNSNTGSPQTSKGNTFAGYGADDTNDAAIHYTPAVLNDLTINVTDGGTTPSVDDRSAGTVTIENNVSVTITVQDANTDPIVDAVVAVYRTSDNLQLANDETDVSGQISFSAGSGIPVYIRVRRSSTGVTRYIPVETVANTGSGLALTVTLQEDIIAAP